MIRKRSLLYKNITILFNYYLTTLRQKDCFAGFSLYVSITQLTDTVDTSVTRTNQSCLPLISTQTVKQTDNTLYSTTSEKKSIRLCYETGLVFTELCEVTLTDTVIIRVGIFQFIFNI